MTVDPLPARSSWLRQCHPRAADPSASVQGFSAFDGCPGPVDLHLFPAHDRWTRGCRVGSRLTVSRSSRNSTFPCASASKLRCARASRY